MERTTPTHLARATMLVSRGPVVDLAGLLPPVTGIVKGVTSALLSPSPPPLTLPPPPTLPLTLLPTPTTPPTLPLTLLPTPTTPPTLPLTLRPTHTTPSTLPLTLTNQQTPKVVPTVPPVVGTVLSSIPSAVSKASSIISSVTKQGSSLISVVSSVASDLTKSKTPPSTSTFTHTPISIRPPRTSSSSTQLSSSTFPFSSVKSTGLSSASKASPSATLSPSVVGLHSPSPSTPHLPIPTSGHISPTVIPTSDPHSPTVIPTPSLRPSGSPTSVSRLPPRPTATASPHTPQNSPSPNSSKPNSSNASLKAATTPSPSVLSGVATFSHTEILALSSGSNPSIPTSINSFIQPQTTSWPPSETMSRRPVVITFGSTVVTVSSPTSGSTSESTFTSISNIPGSTLNHPGKSGSPGQSTASPTSTRGGSNDSVSPGFFNNPAQMVGTFTVVGVVVIAAAVGLLILIRLHRGPRRRAQRIPNVDPDEEREEGSGPMMQRNLQTSTRRSGISGESTMALFEDLRGENPFANPPNPGGSRYQALSTSEAARSSWNVKPHSRLPTSPVDPVDPYGWPVMTSEGGRNSPRPAVSPDPYSTDPDTRAATGWILADGPTLESIGEDDDSDSLYTVGYGTRPITTETRL